MTELARQMGIKLKIDGVLVDLDTANLFYAFTNLKFWQQSYPKAKKAEPILEVVAPKS